MRKILDQQIADRCVSVHLFSNAAVPSRNSVLADFIECTFDGYAPQTPVFSPSFQNGVEDVAAAAALTFTAGPGVPPTEDVVGYFTKDIDGDLSWAEAFVGGPTTMAVEGQEIKVFPQLKLKNYGE